jgi:hypothetical protein
MSAPHVTGVAALAFGMFTHATNLQIRQLILANTDPIASMAGITSTGGRLNAYKTLLNGDAIPPGRVTTLAVADTGSTSLGLRWTATGDDGAVGTATLYDLRRSSSPIDSLNFAAATPLALPAPQVAGSTETAQISGLPFSTGCYFAIRAVDELSNPGPISNIVHVTTLGIPALALAPAALALSLVPGATLDTAVIVTNPGLGRLDYTLPSPAPAGWLAASPASGRVLAGNAARVALRLDATGLTDGTYNVSLPVTSNDPVTGSQSVPVQLIVSASTAVGDPGLARFGLRLVSRNPSAGGATLELSLPAPGPVDVAVFDVRGRRIARLADGAVGAGTHTLRWDAADDRGSSVAPGVYFVRAITRGGTFERRVVILD